MRPWLRRSIYVAIVLLVVAQLFPPATSNPEVTPSQSIHASLPMQPVVASALARACNDCHSNLTTWPWYSKVAPASWLVVSDVRRGRRALNFSEWKSLSFEKRQKLLPEICQEITEREMPTEEYVLMHPRAKLTRVEIDSVCNWAHLAQPAAEQAANE